MKKALLVIIIILAALAVFIQLQPEEFRVSRSTVIAAPADQIFAEVNDLRRWDSWSPWAKLDPNATAEFSGPTQGVGAAMAWEGNSDVGKGSMTITESIANERVKTHMVFVEPMQGEADSAILLEPAGDGTKVSWSMEGTNNFMAKAVNLVMDCEAMVGEQYSKGLANLKSVVESR